MVIKIIKSFIIKNMVLFMKFNSHAKRKIFSSDRSLKIILEENCWTNSTEILFRDVKYIEKQKCDFLIFCKLNSFGMTVHESWA